MVENMKRVASSDQELTVEERNLLSVAYKNVIGARRASWRIVSSIEQKEESKGNEVQVKMIKGYREKIEGELAKICEDILDVLDKHLIPLAASELELRHLHATMWHNKGQSADATTAHIRDRYTPCIKGKVQELSALLTQAHAQRRRTCLPALSGVRQVRAHARSAWGGHVSSSSERRRGKLDDQEGHAE